MNPIERANIEHAVSWKENSYNLLNEANDEASFMDAVKWCGTNGNVARTVRKDSVKPFSDYIFSHRKDIKTGCFDLRTIESFDGVKPISWVSKICHILNPQQYPLIYDEFVRKHFSINTIEEFWNLLLNEREKYQDKKNRQIYRGEASIWAESITNESNK